MGGLLSSSTATTAGTPVANTVIVTSPSFWERWHLKLVFTVPNMRTIIGFGVITLILRSGAISYLFEQYSDNLI